MVYSHLLLRALLSDGAAAGSGAATSETAAATPDKAGPDISQAQARSCSGPSLASQGDRIPSQLRSKKKEDQIAHIEDIDPTMRLDLLAKVMKVPPAGGERDLFQISKTPPVKAAAPEQLTGVEPKVQPYVFVGPRLPAPPPPPPAPPPPHRRRRSRSNITAVSSIRPDGKRTAYFISPGPDGDEILEATEGTVLKGRYRIVQISVDKVVVEDTQEKRRQPLNIEPEVTG